MFREPIRWGASAGAALSLLLGASASAEGGGAWEKLHEADGIEVHRRAVEGSHMLEFRGRGVVDAEPARVIAVIRDAENHKHWMANCNGSHEIEQLGPRVHVVYNRTAAPWPVKDRDVVLHGDLVYTETTARAGFRSVEHDKMPAQDGVVRMPFLKGHWLLTSVDGGRRTHVEYLVHADAGGAIPAWVSNLVSKKLPYKTLLSLRERAKSESYPEYEKKLRADPEYRRFALGEKAAAPATGEEKPAVE